MEALRTAVVKITNHSIPFDHQRPYNRSLESKKGVGTGFVMRELQGSRGKKMKILTAYHVVDFSEQLLVHLCDSGPPLKGKLVSYSQTLDSAIVEVDAEVPKWMTPLEVGDSDSLEPNTIVQAAGHPLALGFTVTTGYVSGRIADPDRIQIDAAINGGNSGGPLLKDSRVVGIVVSGYEGGVQNTNYATPIKEVLSGSGNIVLNLTLSGETSNLILDSYGSKSGSYVSYVNPRSALSKKAGLKEGDILTSLDGHAVDSRGRVNVPWWKYDSLPVPTIFGRKTVKDTYEVEFVSESSGEKVKTTLPCEEDLNVFRDYKLETEDIPCVTLGGVVVQPLSKNLLLCVKEIKKRLMYIFERPHIHTDSVLVVTYVKADSPFIQMSCLEVGDVIISVNGVYVTSVSEYEEQFKKAKEVVVLKTYNGMVACARTKDLKTVSRA